MTTREILNRARTAKAFVAGLTPEAKNKALLAMAESVVERSADILAANAEDMKDAAGNITDVMLDRLALTAQRIRAMADGIRDVAALPDPVGMALDRIKRPDGLVIEKTSVALGVVAIVYESRPNVTSDAAALALKSGNVCILRSGKEAFRSANAIVLALREGLARAGVERDVLQLVQDTDRRSAVELMTAVGYVDLLIPRGGAGLIRACVENAAVPCIETGTGICHIFIDESADIDKALNIVDNAKTSRPSVCNAAEVCLVHKNIAPAFLPALRERLVDDRAARGLVPVKLLLDTGAAAVIDGELAGERDFDTEFLDYVLAVRVMEDINQAIGHIAAHSTHHSDAIVTGSSESSRLFTMLVDSAAVYVNASTRFTDGGEFGLGCEMGISTQKLHARGPMGLRELTTYKYIVTGDGHTR